MAQSSNSAEGSSREGTASAMATDEPASLPCYIYPTYPTPPLFGRLEELAQIDRHFTDQTYCAGPDFRSLALHGTAGVGKSSIALLYADMQIESRELDAMFWITSDKKVNIQQCFTNIAVELKLPKANPRDHATNRILVLDWLQTTKCRWLLIFDNVESGEVVKSYWPTASHGQALVTTRNPAVPSSPAECQIEIEQWDFQRGSRFLLHLLSEYIGQRPHKKDVRAARELARVFEGHALTLVVTAGLIRHQSWSLRQLFRGQNNLPPALPERLRDCHSFWRSNFESLSVDSRMIMGVIAFLNPDSIPQALFEPEGAENASVRFANALDELERHSLIAHSRHNERTFSVHRLVQALCKKFMSTENRQHSFHNATRLLFPAFHRENVEVSLMYQTHAARAIYLPHVLSLKDAFRAEKKANPDFEVTMQYCILSISAQGYLIETHGYDDLIDLLEVNTMAIKTIPTQIHSVDVQLRGTLASHMGQLLARIGNAEEAVKSLKEAADLFSSSIGPIEIGTPEGLRRFENLADGFATKNKFAKAIKIQRRMRAHRRRLARANGEDETEWPATSNLATSTYQIWAGQTAEAKEVLTEDLDQLDWELPPNWAMTAYTNYSLGNAHRANGDFAAAEEHFTAAYRAWTSGGNLISDPFYGACIYRMGCVALDQGKVETAINRLRESSTVTSCHKGRLGVEHARSLHKLSEALRQDSQVKEARELRAEAIKLFLRCCPDATEFDDEKAYDDLVFIWWR